MARRKIKYGSDRFTTSIDLASAAADITIKLWRAAPGTRLRITRCVYINPTGLAANISNFVDIKVLAGAATAFNFSTSTVGQGALTANTPVEMVKSATDTNMVVVAGADLSVFLDTTGTVTLPAGRLVVEGDIY